MSRISFFRKLLALNNKKEKAILEHAQELKIIMESS